MSRRPRRPRGPVLTLAQAAALLGDDQVRTEFDAAFDRYDEDEATEFAIAHPAAERCNDCPGHSFACLPCLAGWRAPPPGPRRRRNQPRKRTRKEVA